MDMEFDYMGETGEDRSDVYYNDPCIDCTDLVDECRSWPRELASTNTHSL